MKRRYRRKSPTEEMAKTSIVLPKKMLGTLNRLCEERKQGLSALLEIAIEEWLRQAEIIWRPEKKRDGVE